MYREDVILLRNIRYRYNNVIKYRMVQIRDVTSLIVSVPISSHWYSSVTSSGEELLVHLPVSLFRIITSRYTCWIAFHGCLIIDNLLFRYMIGM